MSYRRDLIYDIGMHWGLDAQFYLAKGFNVVSVEANPQMAAKMRDQQAREVADGRFAIVDKAIWHTPGEEISFYVNPVKDDWSSTIKNWAETAGHETQEIRVPTVTLAQMFDEFGVPYYLKVDVEGADETVVRQLLADPRRPAYVSVEASSLDLFALLFSAGYDRMQLVNQALHGLTKAPSPSREGAYVDATFTAHMSGLFGRDLPPEGWVHFQEAADRYLTYRSVQSRDLGLGYGWLDVHVTSSAHLSGQVGP